MIANGKLMYSVGSSAQRSLIPREVDVGGLEGREAQEGEDICILTADSRCLIAETNTILQSTYPPIKEKDTHMCIYTYLKKENFLKAW